MDEYLEKYQIVYENIPDFAQSILNLLIKKKEDL